MNGIDVSKIDLDLLSVLHALLAEGSVTRAARRLGVGQPGLVLEEIGAVLRGPVRALSADR